MACKDQPVRPRQLWQALAAAAAAGRRCCRPCRLPCLQAAMEYARPFDSLPDELLGRILALVRPDETRCTRLKRMVALCMRWLGWRAGRAAGRAARLIPKSALANDRSKHAQPPALPPLPYRPAASLVSKRWHHVYWSEPVVWHEFSLFPRSLMERFGTYHEHFQRVQPNRDELDVWLPGKQRQLECVAGAVRCLAILVWLCLVRVK